MDYAKDRRHRTTQHLHQRTKSKDIFTHDLRKAIIPKTVTSTTSSSTVSNVVSTANPATLKKKDITYYTPAINKSGPAFHVHNSENTAMINEETGPHAEDDDDDLTAYEKSTPRSLTTSVYNLVLNPFYRFYNKYSIAVKLENKGNTARDHLANERTFLAWFRTSLSLVTLGIGIVQVYNLSATTAKHHKFGKSLGLVFVVLSILFLYFGCVRYFHAQWALQHGNFPASRGIITSASFCILFLFVSIFAVMIIETASTTRF